jgi:[protein-PII] uridylyltransferase
MEINRDRIQVHARERLEGPAMGGDPKGQVDAFKRFLKLETERLRMRHRFGLGGIEIATGRTYQVDLVVTRACQLAAEEADRASQAELAGCAVVALGGYGRGELAPFSDVDLLFLHGGRPTDAVRTFLRRTLQLLWDMGLTVGHSFRSTRECVQMARDDLHTRTAICEARLVTGHAPLFETLAREMEASLLRDRRATDRFLEALRVELRERYEKHGRTVCVQEPNVKEGGGGLRDLHAVTWVGHARFGSRGMAGLRAEGWISDSEYMAARRPYDFLARVRNEAHFATGRKTDVLTLDLQADVAAAFGFHAKGGLLGSELFMREYYRRASELHRFYRAFMLRHLGPPPRSFLFGLRRPRPRKGYEIKDGMLRVRSPAGEPKAGAMQILEIFAALQEEGALLSDEAALDIRSRLHLVDKSFRTSKDAVHSFVGLFERRGRVGLVVRAMHETGFLARFLPEFARITFMVQHDFFHRYTVDEHTIKALEALDGIATGEDPESARFGRIFDEVKDATPLYLGMLLHDIGKGRGSGHVARGTRIAFRICERLRLDRETAEKVVFLVNAHLDMSQISQRRDLSEPGPVEAFASRVGTLENLDLLFLLTYADHRGVGPGIWNEWKASLLFELYHRTRPCLAGGERRRDDGARAAWARNRAVAELEAEHPPDEVQRHFALLPERYLRTTDAARLVRHFRLLKAAADRPAGFDWAELPGGHWTELTITARDRPGFLAAVAGTLTANGIDILSVDLFTREDGVVLDTFRVGVLPGPRPVDPDRRARLEAALEDAIAGKLDVERAVERWRARHPRRTARHNGRTAKDPVVRFDQEASAVATVVEVKARDEPGLVYTLSKTLAALGLDITFARVATSKALAVDVFYVRGPERRKLGTEAMAAVEKALLGALGVRHETEGEEATT